MAEMMTGRLVRVLARGTHDTLTRVVAEGLAIAEGMDGAVYVREADGTQAWWDAANVVLADVGAGGTG